MRSVSSAKFDFFCLLFFSFFFLLFFLPIFIFSSCVKILLVLFSSIMPFSRLSTNEFNIYAVFSWRLILHIINLYVITNHQPGLKRVCIRSYSGLLFSQIFPHSDWILLTSPYSVRMRENPGKMRTRITPNTDSFYTVQYSVNNSISSLIFGKFFQIHLFYLLMVGTLSYCTLAKDFRNLTIFMVLCFCCNKMTNT